MDRKEIEQILPHRDSMLIPDRIIRILAPEFATGVKRITDDEPCFDLADRTSDGQAADFPVSLMVEFLGQIAAVLCVVSFSELGPRSSLLPIFVSANGVRFRRQARAGETLTGTAWINRRLDPAVEVSGQVRVDGKIVMDTERALIAFKQAAPPVVTPTGMLGLMSESPLEGKAT